MLVHKYNFLLQILKKLMDTSHNFIATKTCPSCEFLVVSGHFRPKKCGAGRVRVGSVRGGSWQDFSNSCGCGTGADKKIQPAQDSVRYSKMIYHCYVAMKAFPPFQPTNLLSQNIN